MEVADTHFPANRTLIYLALIEEEKLCCNAINHDSIIVFQLSIVPLKENLKFNLYSFNIYHFKVFKLQWHMAILSECYSLKM